jgi:hypothetical protein
LTVREILDEQLAQKLVSALIETERLLIDISVKVRGLDVHVRAAQPSASTGSRSSPQSVGRW